MNRDPKGVSASDVRLVNSGAAPLGRATLRVERYVGNLGVGRGRVFGPKPRTGTKPPHTKQKNYIAPMSTSNSSTRGRKSCRGRPFVNRKKRQPATRRKRRNADPPAKGGGSATSAPKGGAANQVQPRERAEKPQGGVPGRNSSGKVLKIKPFCSEEKQILMCDCIPHRYIKFTSQSEAIGHVVAHYSRMVATNDLRRHMTDQSNTGLKYTSILDVGGSPMNYSNRVHCCENSMSPYMLQKKEEWTSKHGPPLVNGTHDNTKWTWCDCEASQCTHGVFDVAMFVHSIYYNGPEQIANILENTRRRVGYSIHHTKFDEKEGEFYGGECKYFSSGRFRNGFRIVTFKAEGNSICYRHSAHDWMFEGGAVAVSGDRTLLYSAVEPGFDGATVVQKFSLVDGPVQNVCTAYNPPVDDINVPSAGVVLVEKDNLRLTECDGVMTLTSGLDSFIVPEKLFAELLRYQAGKQANKKTFDMLLGQARRLCRAQLNKDYSPMVLALAPTAMALVVQLYVIEHEEEMLRKFFTFDHQRDMNTHNEWLSWTRWEGSYHWWMCVIIVLVWLWWVWHQTTQFPITEWMIKFSGHPREDMNPDFPLHVCAFYAASGWEWRKEKDDVDIFLGTLGRKDYDSANYCRGIIFFGGLFDQLLNTSWLFFLIGLLIAYGRRPGWVMTCFMIATSFLVAPWWILKSMESVVYKGVTVTAEAIAAQYHSYADWQWLFFICVMLLLFRNARASAVHPFDVIHRSIHDERCLPVYDGPYPEGYCTLGFETEVDPGLYPMHDNATLKDEVEDVRQWPAREAIRFVGPVFTAAVPVAFSRSDHNLLVAVRTRAIPAIHDLSDDAVMRRKEAWMELEAACDGLLPMHLDHFVISSDTDPIGSLYDGDVLILKHVHPTYPTWNQYVERFPPAKRQVLRAAKLKLDEGELRTGMFCYSGFVKREKQMIVTQDDYIPTRPRLIQGLSVFMKVLRGVWFLHYSNMLKFVWHVRNFIWYSSGITTDQQSFWLNYHLARLGPCIVFFSDFSKYDITQGAECMLRERTHYESLGFADDEEGKLYLKAQARSKVYSAGMMWAVDATRKSGDSNTSSGNTKNTGEAVWSWIAPLCIAKAINPEDHVAIACLGDDNFALLTIFALNTIFEGETSVLEKSMTAHMSRLGYEVKVGTSFNPTVGEYLSLRFYPVDGEYVVGKKPGRVLTKMGTIMARQGVTGEQYYEYLKGTLISYLPTANHVPFLRKYVSVVLQRLAGYKAKFAIETAYRAQGRIYEACDDTWAAFMDLYGSDLDQERELEFEKALLSRPLQWMHDSAAVKQMFEIDFSL